MEGGHQGKEERRAVETGLQINDRSEFEAHLISTNCSLIMRGAANLGCRANQSQGAFAFLQSLVIIWADLIFTHGSNMPSRCSFAAEHGVQRVTYTQRRTPSFSEPLSDTMDRETLCVRENETEGNIHRKGAETGKAATKWTKYLKQECRKTTGFKQASNGTLVTKLNAEFTPVSKWLPVHK